MKAIRSISSLVLALLVLMASSSFYVGVHVCAGKVKAIAFSQEADGCGHAKLPPCHRALMKGCCEDETIRHDSQDFNGSISSIDIAVAPAIEITLPPVLLSEIIPSFEISAIPYSDYSPPGRVTDRVVALQVFLI